MKTNDLQRRERLRRRALYNRAKDRERGATLRSTIDQLSGGSAWDRYTDRDESDFDSERITNGATQMATATASKKKTRSKGGKGKGDGDNGSPAKKKRTRKDEQIPLIDTTLPNQKTIKKLAREYRGAVAERVAWLNEEKALKARLSTAIHKSGVVPDGDGSFRIVIDDMTITVEPRDELIRVREGTED